MVSLVMRRGQSEQSASVKIVTWPVCFPFRSQYENEASAPLGDTGRPYLTVQGPERPGPSCCSPQDAGMLTNDPTHT